MSDEDLENSLKKLKTLKLGENENNEVCAIVLKSLRDYCARSPQNQSLLANQPGFFDTVNDFLERLLEGPATSNILLCRTLQVIGNVIVGQKRLKQIAWEQYRNLIKQCVHDDCANVQYAALMIMYNVALDDKKMLFELTDLFQRLIDLTQIEKTADYATFLLELMFCDTNFVTEKYNSLSPSSRLIVLSIIEAIYNNPRGRQFPKGMLQFLSTYFSEKGQRVLQSKDNMDEMDVIEIAKILEIINALGSSREEYLKELQTLNELLVFAVGILKIVHNISKEEGNQFSMLLKMAELETTEPIEGQPTFGFKASLIRLIGILCYKNKVHQDAFREMGAIPLILDCCKIDGRNPLIIQWAVLAMRNLCEENVENQMVVASVDANGHVDPSSLLNLGLQTDGSDAR